MPPLFREKPPLTLVEQIVRTCGVERLGDATWFTKQQIQLTQFSEFLPELEPYYVPCKAAEFLHPPLTPARALTILRHILRVYNAQLLSSEKSRGGSKSIWYQIQSETIHSGIEISFD